MITFLFLILSLNVYSQSIIDNYHADTVITLMFVSDSDNNGLFVKALNKKYFDCNIYFNTDLIALPDNDNNFNYLNNKYLRFIYVQTEYCTVEYCPNPIHLAK